MEDKDREIAKLHELLEKSFKEVTVEGIMTASQLETKTRQLSTQVPSTNPPRSRNSSVLSHSSASSTQSKSSGTKHTKTHSAHHSDVSQTNTAHLITNNTVTTTTTKKGFGSGISTDEKELDRKALYSPASFGFLSDQNDNTIIEGSVEDLSSIDIVGSDNSQFSKPNGFH